MDVSLQILLFIALIITVMVYLLLQAAPSFVLFR